jgi:hypothetical protein
MPVSGWPVFRTTESSGGPPPVKPSFAGCLYGCAALIALPAILAAILVFGGLIVGALWAVVVSGYRLAGGVLP